MAQAQQEHGEGMAASAPPVFDEVSGRPLNDRARVLMGEEPLGYNEVSSLDEALHLSAAKKRPIVVPRSKDEWQELLLILTEDNESPSQPKAVDALSQALTKMAAGVAPPYVNDLGFWLATRLGRSQDGEAQPNVTLKCLKVMITLMDGGVGAVDEDETDAPPSLTSRLCQSGMNMWAPTEGGDLQGALTSDGGGSGSGGGTLDGGGVGELWAVSIRSHCVTLLTQLCEHVGEAHPQWGDRPAQMVRAAARGAMIRANGRSSDFGVEYTKQRRLNVGANELVAWEFRERSVGGPHTIGAQTHLCLLYL